MVRTLYSIASLLAGVALLLLGAGLLNTIIPLRGGAMGFSPGLLGALTSAYFVGFFMGTFAAPRLIRRVGHIRAFAFYAASCACLVLIHALSGNAWLWMGLRLATGMVLVGLYTVIESWLNAQADPSSRGSVFATYMVVNLGSLALAQQLLWVDGRAPFMAYTLVALLICAATLPVLLTRMLQPELQPAPRLQLRRLHDAAPSALVGALLSGLALGAFWGLTPVYAAHLGMSTGSIGDFMSVAIVGGAALQWPTGRLSDRHDRRLALALICGVAAAVAILTPVLAGWRPALFIGIFLFGGMSFAVYPIVVAHLLDHLPPEDLLGASSSVLLVNGIGSALGPLVAGMLMGALGPATLFAWFALTQALLAGYAFYRYRAFRREVVTDSPPFVPMLRTTPAALNMLPGVEDEATVAAD